MLKTGATIIPVFYDVRPKDLRWVDKGKGKYASAFKEHEKKGRFDFQTISAWKSALKKVSNLSGHDFQGPNTLHGDIGQLLESLDKAVFRNLKPAPLEVATYPVGLDEAIRDFESCMESQRQNENEKVKIVGIVGFGGSGKTTLATEIFNRRRSSFERSSFLSDLRDASDRNTLANSQRKLLEDLLRVTHCKIDSVREGKGMMRERLQSSTPRVLIVFDDIDHRNQVEDLLVKDVLGSGSLIIVTSRDEDALKLSESGPIYKIKKLDPEDAQYLFCKYAFLQPYPIVGFEELTTKFCERCGRLPLFLKVMGAHLRVKATNNRNKWEDELDHIPNGILQILNVSYNALDEKEKQIFLDIACFFLGEEKNLAIKVWDTCERRGLYHLENLQTKCLVELDGQNCFKMHDHLRDFGRQIADRESPCRLWDKSQAEQQEVNLRQLRIVGMDLSMISIPENGCSRLEHLELRCSDKLIEVKHLPQKLETLNMCRCPNLRHLEGLEHMRQLQYLDISWCSELHELPSLQHLALLEQLNASHCANLRHLEGLEHLRQLRELHIPGCSELPSLQHLASLQWLNVSYCANLRHLEGLKHLRQL